VSSRPPVDLEITDAVRGADSRRLRCVASERRAETELSLQHEQFDKQHSDKLAQEELFRQMRGGNAGTEDLVRE
jgi:hypothetical protein